MEILTSYEFIYQQQTEMILYPQIFYPVLKSEDI